MRWYDVILAVGILGANVYVMLLALWGGGYVVAGVLAIVVLIALMALWTRVP